mgnify:CR=1 FL=1
MNPAPQFARFERLADARLELDVVLLQLEIPLAAVAAWKGLWELTASPFYWDKTTHGLHDGHSLAAHL